MGEQQKALDALTAAEGESLHAIDLWNCTPLWIYCRVIRAGRTTVGTKASAGDLSALSAMGAVAHCEQDY